MAGDTTVYGFLNGMLNPDVIPKEDVNLWSDTMELFFVQLAELLTPGAWATTDFNGSIVPGALSIDVSAGEAIVGDANGRKLVQKTATTTVTGLTASNTNYVYLQRDGTFAKNITGTPPANSILVLTCVTDVTEVTSVNDAPSGRINLGSLLASRRFVPQRLSKSVAGSSNVTLTSAEYDCPILELTGAIGANINVVTVTEAGRVWWVKNHTTGAYTVTFKTAAGSGVVIPQGGFAAVYCDGTNILPAPAASQQLFGTGASGAIANLTDADTQGTTGAQSGTLSATDNRIYRFTGAVTLSQAITVARQNGLARGSYPATYGSPGLPLGAILSAAGSKGIPSPIRPGGGNTGLVGGRFQLLAKGAVAANANISATGTNAASDGGGGGGLIVIVSATSITVDAAATLDVSGGAGHATAAAKGGGGGYSDAFGGHAGLGGSGGGGAPYSAGGAAGAGIAAGQAGGAGTSTQGGGGGGSIDNVGQINQPGDVGGAGGNGTSILLGLSPNGLILKRTLTPTAATAGTTSTSAGGAAGTNGGGGGGGGGNSGGDGVAGGNGGDYGSGGGGGSRGSTGVRGAGGTGAAGNSNLFAVSDLSPYAGKPAGNGGGGGGGGDSGGAGGSGAAGAASLGYGDGAGGAGANGSARSGNVGGAGGAGGNGGGAAGLVLLIAPTVTVSGTVTGRLVTITGADALNFLRGYGLD